MFTPRRFSPEKDAEALGTFTMMEAGSDNLKKTMEASLVVFHFSEWFYHNVAYIELASESFIQDVAEQAAAYTEQLAGMDSYTRLKQAIYVVASGEVLRQRIAELQPENQKQEREKADYLRVVAQIDAHGADVVRMAHADVVITWMPGESRPNRNLITKLQNFANSLDRIHKSARQYGW